MAKNVSGNTPKHPPDWVFDKMDKNWTIKPNEGVVLSTRTGGSLGTIGKVYGYVLLPIADYYPVRRSHIIWFGANGDWPTQEIDHEDRNKTNDKIINLRYLTQSENTRNSDRSLSRDLPPGLYRKTNGSFQVCRSIEGRTTFLRWFSRHSLEEAIKFNTETLYEQE